MINRDQAGKSKRRRRAANASGPEDRWASPPEWASRPCETHIEAGVSKVERREPVWTYLMNQRLGGEGLSRNDE